MQHNFSEEELQRAELFEKLGKEVARGFGAKWMWKDIAHEALRRALMKLMKKWPAIRAEHGEDSFRHWLETTTYNEYLAIIRKERRNVTDSLTEPVSNRAGEAEAHTLGDTLEVPALPEVLDDELELLDKVLTLMPSRCRLKMRAGLTQCGDECRILTRRYASEEKKVTVQILAEEAGVPHGTMNGWLEVCEERLKKLWNENS